MAVTLPPFMINPLSGWLSDKFGPKIPVSGGLILTIPFLLLLRIPTGHGTTDAGQEVLICAILALLSTSLSYVLTTRCRIKFRHSPFYE